MPYLAGYRHTIYDYNLYVSALFNTLFYSWYEASPGIWEGVAHHIGFRLKQDKQSLFYQVFAHSDGQIIDDTIIVSLLHRYFQLDVDLKSMVNLWSKSDPYIAKISTQVSGIRILGQDPIENVFSFICSSNNNINRISRMISTLCEKFGQKLHMIQDVEGPTRFEHHFDFPTIRSLASGGVEQALKDFGFGYRAKYIVATAQKLQELNSQSSSESVCDPSDIPHMTSLWLQGLSAPRSTYESAKKALQILPGVGPKVADCVCLMSLNHSSAVPIDTHVWQVTARNYMPQLIKSQKSLTDKVYKEIGNFYRSKFGDYAGWAHDILFCAELPHGIEAKMNGHPGSAASGIKSKRSKQTVPGSQAKSASASKRAKGNAVK